MRTLWNGLQWTGRKLAFLGSLVVAAVAILLLPALVVMQRRGFHIDLAHYWDLVRFHLMHLAKGQLIPPPASLAVRDYLRSIPLDVAEALPVTLKLLGTAFAASMLLGLAIGALMSVVAPRWLRAVTWGATTMLYSLPDLLIASTLYLAVLLVAILRGGVGPLRGPEAWHHFWAPAVALTLTVLPYIARVTATAIDEISGEQYIRAAVARGIHPTWILIKHVGKHVIIRVSTILPVVVSLLFSSGAVVEYMSELHGLGRLLIINAGPRAVDRYAGVAVLLPMLVLFTIVLALSELIQRLLDPRIAPAGAGSAATLAASPIGLGRPTLKGLGGGLVSLGAWLRSIPALLRAGLVALPGRLRQGVRDPVLLFGALLVLGLVAVAVAAPWLAPQDPERRIVFLTLPSGHILVPPLAPSPDHWFGTDDYGRDLLSRILFGTRYALLFAVLVVPARFLLAVPFGLIAAFRGGAWERIIRWLATFFTAVPQVLLPLALIPSINLIFMNRPGMALFWAVTLVALPGAPRLASSVRQQASEVMAQPFVEGAHAVGAGTGRTLIRYLLPQMSPQLVTMLTLEVPAVLTLTALLGYFRAYPGGAIFDTQGYQPLAPLLSEWGSMMDSPLMVLLAGRWWLWAPFLALFVAVLAFNLLGEGLRRTLVSRTGWKWQG